MNRTSKALLILCFLIALKATVAFAEEKPSSESQRRFASLCRLWGTLKLFHPYLAYRNINWDSAFVTAVPLAGSATNSGEYAQAIKTMIDPLGDPVTRVLLENFEVINQPQEQPLHYEFTVDSILIFRVNNYASLMDLDNAQMVFREVAIQLPKARGVVIDLRAPAPLSESESGYLNYLFNDSGLENRLAAGTVTSPGERRRLYSGFPTQVGSTSGGYWSSFVIRDGQQFEADVSGFKHPVAFVVNRFGEIPMIALALQSSRQATILSEGAASEASITTTQRFDAGEGVIVEFRLGEIIYGDGSIGLHVQRVVPAPVSGLGEEVMRVALAWVSDPDIGQFNSQKVPIVAVLPKDNAYPTMRYPTFPYRLLAAARVWSVFNHFFPYNHLMGTTWDSVLSASIPAFASARDSIEYGLAIAGMIAHSHDTHVRATNSPHEYFFGTGRPPFLVQFIEQKAVVTHLLDSSTALAAGIRVGDIVTAVDNEDIGTRMRRYSPYIAASTPQSLLRSVAGYCLRGPDSTVGTYAMQDVDGKSKTVRILRKRSSRGLLKSWRSGDIIRMLPGNIGYADLERLPVSMVDSMFETFRNTRAIIFDGRGYPRGTAWPIAPRLSERIRPVAALFSRSVVTYPNGLNGELAEQSEVYSFKQAIPATEKWRYKGATVLLIDERAISQAEHTGLFFKAAGNITFVGSHTAGANGDVTDFVLPGGILVLMTGQSVQYPDGRQLQRVGLVPEIEVRPTVKGFRAGRDEVLERAIDDLNKNLNKN